MAKQKAIELKFENEELYRELCIPFKSVDDANKALDEFINEVYNLRAKHRIRDVLFVLQVPVKYDDGTEGQPIAHAMFGDVNRAEGLAAYAFGRTAGERQQRIADMNNRALRAVESLKDRA